MPFTNRLPIEKNPFRTYKQRASVHILLGRRQSLVENQQQTDQLTYDAGSEISNPGNIGGR